MTKSPFALPIRFARTLRCSAVATCLLLLATPVVVGQDGEELLEAPEVSSRLNQQPVPLWMVTFGDTVTWSILAVLAPANLLAGTLLYAYPMEEALSLLERGRGEITEDGSETNYNDDIVVDLDWYVGTAVRDNEVWEAYPVPAEFRPLVETVGHLNLQRSQLTRLNGQQADMTEVSSPSAGPSNMYLVSNFALTDLEIAERLWTRKRVWRSALEEFGGGDLNGPLTEAPAATRPTHDYQ